MGHIDTNLLFSFILGLLGIIVSVVIWAASTHAARVTAREARLSRESLVDIETLNQIKAVYESAIQQLEAEVGRLRSEARQFEQRALALEAELHQLRASMRDDQGERVKRHSDFRQDPPAEPVAET
jgi:predicted RNase H-like nuclease (RuvC/YqgF family)